MQLIINFLYLGKQGDVSDQMKVLSLISIKEYRIYYIVTRNHLDLVHLFVILFVIKILHPNF